jgi:hypothetical protein
VIPAASSPRPPPVPVLAASTSVPVRLCPVRRTPSIELLRPAHLGIRRPPWPLSDQSPIPPSARVAVADQRRSVQEPLSLGSPPRESAGLVLARSLLLLSLGSLLGPRSIPPRDSSSAWIGLPARPDFRSLLLAPSAAVCPRTCPDRIDPQRRPLALFPH